MEPTLNPKEVNNPELSLNPNAVGSTPQQAKSELDASTKEIQSDLDALINTSINDSAQKQKLDLTMNKSESEKKDEKKKELLRQRKLPTLIIVHSVVLLLLLSLGVWWFLFVTYLGYQKSGQVDAKYAPYMAWVDRQYESIVRTLQLQPLDKFSPQQLITTDTNNNNIITQIIQDDEIDFIQKKKVMQQWVSMLYSDVINRYTAYEQLKNTIWQQWFFPTSIASVATEESLNNSIQKAIVSVESIRFAVALKYFSLLDSFVTQLSSYSSTSKDVVAQKLQMFVNRGEKDINLYVTTCYLNGYETSSSCAAIGDFFNYYKYIDTSLTDKDISLFLFAMDLIEWKLENTDFPSLDVSVRDINTTSNTINVSVEINTFKEDEARLVADNGILNPHIYLMTTMVNHLRQSRYVLTDTVSVNQLNVDQKRVRVGGQTISVNTSSFSFTLPLQNAVEREIYDFTDRNNDILQ